MKKTLLIVMCGFLFASLAGAVILPCSSYNGADVKTITTGGGCTLGGLFFNNFNYQGTGNYTPGNFILTGENPPGGQPNVDSLAFNPAIGPGSDVQFIFSVQGGALGADLTNNGTANSNIQEINCTVMVPLGGTQNCQQLGGTVLWSTSANGGQSAPPTGEFFYAQGSQPVVWVWKDLNANASGAQISAFTETFGVPEPTTLLLIGGGLAALGLVRRRKKA